MGSRWFHVEIRMSESEAPNAIRARKVRVGETPTPAHETRALPGVCAREVLFLWRLFRTAASATVPFSAAGAAVFSAALTVMLPAAGLLFVGRQIRNHAHGKLQPQKGDLALDDFDEMRHFLVRRLEAVELQAHSLADKLRKLFVQFAIQHERKIRIHLFLKLEDTGVRLVPWSRFHHGHHHVIGGGVVS